MTYDEWKTSDYDLELELNEAEKRRLILFVKQAYMEDIEANIEDYQWILEEIEELTEFLVSNGRT